MGEASKSSNRKFKILNENTILFKPNRKTIINLKIEAIRMLDGFYSEKDIDDEKKKQDDSAHFH